MTHRALAQPLFWRDRFEAIAACALQGQLVHRAFAPLWANAAFADLFGYDTLEDALAAPSLEHLFDDAAQADCRALVAAGVGRSVHGRFGRRMMRRRDGAAFHAEIYARRVNWDGQDAIAVAILEISEPPLARSPDAIYIAAAAADRPAIRRALAAPLHRIRFAPLLFAEQTDPAAPDGIAAAIVDVDLPDAPFFVRRARQRADVPVVAVGEAPPAQAFLQALGADAFVEKAAMAERLGDVLALLTRSPPRRSVEPPERSDVEDEHQGDEPADDIDRDHV